MSNSFIRRFHNFRNIRNQKNKESSIKESVKVINDKFIVGGIELKQSIINSYIKKVKDSTGQDLNNTYSKEEIAEQLVNYIISEYGDSDNIPPSALLGGDENMVDQVDDVSLEEEDAVVDDEGISEIEDTEEEETEEEETEEEETDETDETEEIDDSDEDFQDIDDDTDSDTDEDDTDEDDTDEDELPL